MRFGRMTKAMVAVLVALGISGAFMTACQRMVEVKSGTHTVCTAGEVISDDVKTVKVPANKVGAYRVRTVTTTCDKHTKLAALYAEAQVALGAGDTKLAAAKLAEVLVLDPAYRKAPAQAASIAKGVKTAPDTSTAPVTPPASPVPGTPPAPPVPGAPTTTTIPVVPPKPGETTATVGALVRWMPDAISGFVAAKPLSDPVSVSREYIPSGSSPAQGLVIVAEQFRTAADAKKALEHEVKQAYTKDADTIKINGHDAYYGTDGRRFAAIGFTDGAVMVALELTAPKSPNSLRSLAEQVAKQLP